MTKCLIESDAGGVLGATIRELRVLHSMDLSDNRLGSYGVGAFGFRGLCGNVSLETLIIERNACGDAGAAGIAKGLSSHPSLMMLSLQENEVGPVGADALGDALCKTHTLHTLRLGSNLLQKDGATPMAKVLMSNQSLTSLDISDNGLGGSKLDAVLILSTGYDGVVSLADAVKNNKSLLYLNMAGNKVGKVGMRAFSDALTYNKCLCRMLFDDEDHVELVETGVKHNKSVTDLGCEPTPGMITSLNKNKNLRQVFRKGLRESSLTRKQIQKYIDKGVDLWNPEEGPMYLLHRAAPDVIGYYHSMMHVRNYIYSSRDILNDLSKLSQAALVALAKQKGSTSCFFVATRLGHVTATRIMLQHGADINSHDGMTRTALQLATEHGHLALIQVLLKAGANPNTHLFGLSLFMLAVKNGFVELIKYYSKVFPEQVRRCSPAPKSRTALHVAAKSGRLAVCKLLLEMEFDVSAVSGDGKTPLLLAATPEICELFLSRGADIKYLAHGNNGDSANCKVCKHIRGHKPPLGPESLAIAIGGHGKNAVYNALFPEGGVPLLDVVTYLVEHHADSKSAFEGVLRLNINYCYRDNLPVWIGKLHNLEELEVVEGNELRSIPRNIIEGGNEAVLRYLKDMTGGKKDIWDGFKIMVLGKEGVGKTHIFHLASGKVYPRNASTDGIDIHSFKLELPNEKQVPVTWFDFGGQEVFYPTHELFLTGQCVYLIAFNMNDPEYEVRVTYWLRVVATFSLDRAKVVLVGTHKDKLSDPVADVAAIDMRIRDLISDSTTVVDMVYMSCLDDPVQIRGLLTEALMAASQQAKLGGKEVPHIYTVIKDWAIDQKERDPMRPYFHWEDFCKSFPGYDSYLLERACEFLHDMGSIFLAKRFSANKKANLICVDVQWIAKAFSAIVTMRHNWVKAGVLRQDALTHIWREFGITDVNEVLAIMSLFEKFNIAFPRRQDGCWIIPSMLPDVEPEKVAERAPMELRSHARVFKLSVLPSGAFGQALARMSEWGDVAVVAMWRFGIMLQDQSELALLRVENGSELHLTIFPAPQDVTESVIEQFDQETVDGAGTLLRRIDEELQMIFKQVFRRMNTLPLTTLILCPHCIAVKAPTDECVWLNYEDVVKMILSGERRFVCGEISVSVDMVGEDLTMGYVHAYAAREIRVDKEPLARGGFGLIYKGVMKSGGVKIVVKELIVETGSEVSFFADFQREVSLMRQLRHRNLVTMHGIMLSPLRMVLELCDGGDLLGALRRGKIKERDSALQFRLAVDVARGMDYLHSLKPPLAHRDLRSPNVLLMSFKAGSPDPVAKVADFGMTAAATSRLTQELLTWQWMAPEAFLGENYTETCDLYSYGMIVWEIFTCTGEIPFQAVADLEENKKKQAREFMNEIIHNGLRPMCGSSFPPEVAEMILALWERNPNMRPSFGACLEFLENFSGPVADRTDNLFQLLLNRDRARIVAAQEQNLDLPEFNVSVKDMGPLLEGEILSCCTVRMSVKGEPETVWIGTAEGSVFVFDPVQELIHHEKNVHKGGVTVLCCSTFDGTVASGGGDGIVLRFTLSFPKYPVLVAVEIVEEGEDSAEKTLEGAAEALNRSDSYQGKAASQPLPSTSPRPRSPRPSQSLPSTSGWSSATVRTGKKVGLQMGSKSPSGGRSPRGGSTPTGSVIESTPPPSGGHSSSRIASKSPRPELRATLGGATGRANSSSTVTKKSSTVAGMPKSSGSANLTSSSSSAVVGAVGERRVVVGSGQVDDNGVPIPGPNEEIIWEIRPLVEHVMAEKQPHKGTAISALVALAGSGMLLAGDADGLITAWQSNNDLVFEMPLTEIRDAGRVRTFCPESDARVWVTAGSRLWLIQVDKKSNSLIVADSLAASTDAGFAGALSVGGGELWVADGAHVQIIDAKKLSVRKALQLPAMGTISTLAPIMVMGRRTVWAGAADLVSIWDIKSKAAVKAHSLPNAGSPSFIVEVGENAALIDFGTGPKIFDLNNNSI